MTIEERLNKYNSKHKVKLSIQMVDYVRTAHKETSYIEMRKHLGLSISAFRSLTTLMGVTSDEHHAKLRKIVEENAPYMTYKEMSEKFGYDKSYWGHLANKYGVKSSKEKEKRVSEIRRNAVNELKTKEGYWDKISGIMRRKWRMEYFRERSGLPRQTGLILKKTSKIAYNLIYAYTHYRGYIQDEYDFKTLYYDDNTKRSNSEKQMMERYKLKILPISEKKGQ